MSDPVFADIKDLLARYSKGELAAFLGDDILESYEAVTGSEVPKTVVVDSVATMYGHEILADTASRRTLIERSDTPQAQSLLEQMCSQLGIEYLEPQAAHVHELLCQLADNEPGCFASLFGLYSSDAIAEASDESVVGIKTLHPAYPLYPYQQAMVRKALSLMEGPHQRCLLHLPTGAGKTRTAMNIAAEHLRSTRGGLVLWLADTSELCAQAASEFGKAWHALGNNSLKLYSYYSDTNISLGGIDEGFLVAGLQKLNAAHGSQGYRVLYEQLREHVTLVVFDEAHKAIAPTYSRIVTDMMNLRKSTFLIGLSATPGRRLDFEDGQDERLAAFFGDTKVTMSVAGYTSPIQYLVANRYLAAAEFISIDYRGASIQFADEFSSPGRAQEILDVLSEDSARNLELLRVIEEEHCKGSSIIAFACSVEHSVELASMLSFRGVKAFSLDSKNDNNKTRRYKISKYLSGDVRVLINFNILTAGFDAPKTNVAIIARPTDSLVMYSQMAGRAMRGARSGGNDQCRIYTVRDDIPAFRSVTQAFMHWDDMWNEV